MPRGLSTSSIAPADVRLRAVQSMAAPLKAMDPVFNVRWRVRERFSFMVTPKDVVRFASVKVLGFGQNGRQSCFGLSSGQRRRTKFDDAQFDTAVKRNFKQS